MTTTVQSGPLRLSSICLLLLWSPPRAAPAAQVGPADNSAPMPGGGYDAIVRAVVRPKPACPATAGEGISVCANRRAAPSQRLPLYEDEKENESGVRGTGADVLATEHLHCGPTSCDPPNRQMETIHRLWQAVTGADPQ
jgi:hypothetical protein